VAYVWIWLINTKYNNLNTNDVFMDCKPNPFNHALMFYQRQQSNANLVFGINSTLGGVVDMICIRCGHELVEINGKFEHKNNARVMPQSKIIFVKCCMSGIPFTNKERIGNSYYCGCEFPEPNKVTKTKDEDDDDLELQLFMLSEYGFKEKVNIRRIFLKLQKEIKRIELKYLNSELNLSGEFGGCDKDKEMQERYDVIVKELTDMGEIQCFSCDNFVDKTSIAYYRENKYPICNDCMEKDERT
jgi:hypothetical protein